MGQRGHLFSIRFHEEGIASSGTRIDWTELFGVSHRAFLWTWYGCRRILSRVWSFGLATVQNSSADGKFS